MTEQPNIFKFATSELSQDAFLCYLLSFGKEAYKGSEEYTAAKDFLELCGIDEDVIEVKKQYGHIDVLIVTRNNCLIIEDKTSSFEHDNQMQRYTEEILSKKDYNDKKITALYFKTGFTSEKEKRYLRNKHNNICIVGHDSIYNIFNKPIKNVIINQWKENFMINYQRILKAKSNNDYQQIFSKKNFLGMECALDNITTEILEQTEYKDSYWYIVDQGNTPHLCLYEKFSNNIGEYVLHHAIYLMFRKKNYSLVVKQHVCKNIIKENEGQVGTNNKGMKERIRIKDYAKLPQEVIEIKNNIRNELEKISDWKSKGKDEKDNLMVIQKDFEYSEDILTSIKNQKENIAEIIKKI